MNIKEQRTIITLTGLFALLIIIVAIISSYWPSQEEFFIELGLLGKNKTADAYFSNDESILEVGNESNWYVYIHNYLENPQNISIKVKLLNSTMQLPDDRQHNPSPATTLIELSKYLSVDEIAILPCFWSIKEIDIQDNSILIKTLIINEEIIDVRIENSINSDYILVFELWTYDSEKTDYIFSWVNNEQFFSNSLYMRFLLNQ